MPTIYQIIIAALTTAFIILFANKSEIRIKLRDWCDIKKLSLIAKMLDCDFCLSFWMNLLFAIVCTFISCDASWLFIPIFSTPLTRFLL